ncbi:hypothetical protein THAOC_29783 [Thalassiosira oceanica]|uniref:Uncharacterized protein n=1 Tax=Thalassiosira oceanica TaxID=159749 RepID=K0RQE8_THAOC|nr:hypothetical protein THAOC_29783 [Thalassiosira oceanica]|eukprot:EJK51081.1 hypothetical protein THAOC_29783 [Thalassiosira oceanica]
MPSSTHVRLIVASVRAFLSPCQPLLDGERDESRGRYSRAIGCSTLFRHAKVLPRAPFQTVDCRIRNLRRVTKSGLEVFVVRILVRAETATCSFDRRPPFRADAHSSEIIRRRVPPARSGSRTRLRSPGAVIPADAAHRAGRNSNQLSGIGRRVDPRDPPRALQITPTNRRSVRASALSAPGTVASRVKARELQYRTNPRLAPFALGEARRSFRRLVPPVAPGEGVGWTSEAARGAGGGHPRPRRLVDR